MKIDAPIALLGASYNSRDAAVDDFDSVWAARLDGDFHHTAVAVLARDADGALHVERVKNTAKYLEWGGALLGAGIFVLAPDTGIELLSAVGVSGAGAIVGHFRRNTRPEDLAVTAGLLEVGDCGLVVVVVNRAGKAITPLLRQADSRSSVDMVWGDLEEELSQDFARPAADLVLVAT